MGHTNIENMRQSGNKFSRWAKAKPRELPYVKQTLVSIFLVSVNIRSYQQIVEKIIIDLFA